MTIPFASASTGACSRSLDAFLVNIMMSTRGKW